MPKVKAHKRTRLGGVEHGHRCTFKVLRKAASQQKRKRSEKCNRWTVATGPYCWQHTLQEENLKVMPSTIPICGMGLFACKPRTTSTASATRRPRAARATTTPTTTARAKNDIVFRKGDDVATFGGQWYPSDHPKANGDYALSLRVGKDKETGEEIWETLNGEQTDSGNARYANSVGGPAEIDRSLQNTEITQWGKCSRKSTLVALRDIRDGEEIFCDYGPDYTF